MNGTTRYLSSFRQCVDRCISRNYHGSAPSTKCSFTRSANYKQTWNSPPVKVITSVTLPIYGQPLHDGALAAGDVRKTSTHLSRVIRGIFQDRRIFPRKGLVSEDDHSSDDDDDDQSSNDDDNQDYTTACYNCISSTCRFLIYFGKIKLVSEKRTGRKNEND